MDIREYVSTKFRLLTEAQSSGNDSGAREHLDSLSSGVARILGSILEKQPDWGTHRWLDYIVPTALIDYSVPADPIYGSSRKVKLTGFAIWGLTKDFEKPLSFKDPTEMWIEPVEIEIGFSAADGRMRSFVVRLADAEEGLGAHALNLRQQLRLRGRGKPELANLETGMASGKWVYEIWEE